MKCQGCANIFTHHGIPCIVSSSLIPIEYFFSFEDLMFSLHKISHKITSFYNEGFFDNHDTGSSQQVSHKITSFYNESVVSFNYPKHQIRFVKIIHLNERIQFVLQCRRK